MMMPDSHYSQPHQAQVFCGESMSGGRVQQKDGMGAAEVIFCISIYD